MKHKFTFLLMAGVVLATGPVFAQNVNSMDMRLNRIEREMQTLSRSIYKGDVPPPSVTSSESMDSQQAAAMEVRLGQMEEQIRRLTGMVEETHYKLRQLEKKGTLSNVAPKGDGMNDRSSSALSSDGGAKPYQLGTLNGSSGEANSPAALYDQAFSYLQKNDYASAQSSLDQFLEKYPDHDLAANAKYWLGETYYARGDYQGASRAFAVSYKDFPDGQKAPDSLLKLAMSLKQQNMDDEACLTLAEIDKQFPNAPASIKSKVHKEGQTYGCK